MNVSRRSYAQAERYRRLPGVAAAWDLSPSALSLSHHDEPCSIRTLTDMRRAMGPDALDGFGTVRGRFTGEE
jgi:hypothetical protein